MSMISVSVLKKRIKETEKQIEEFKEFLPSSIAEFQISELSRRLCSLTDELNEMEESQARETITLRMYGENIETGKISNRILVSVLGGFQTLADDIANTLIGNNALRGQLNTYIKEITDFEVCGTFAGSFGVKLEKDYQQLEITNTSLKTNDILQELFSIFENSSSGEKLIERISPYGSRTVNCYREWIKQLKDEGVNLDINWTNEVAEQRKVKIKYSFAKDIMSALDSINEIKNEDMVFNATITGINIRKNTFELKTEENNIIKGKSRLETLIKASGYIGTEVTVKLVKSVVISTACGNKESWFLADILKVE